MAERNEVKLILATQNDRRSIYEWFAQSDIVEAREYFLSKPGVVEEKPFNQPVPVFKVGGKMFALINIHEPERTSINLKYYKDENVGLREVYPEIVPGYHMNKNHWNTVYLDGSLEEGFIRHLIDVSYELVFKSLTKIKQKEIMESMLNEI